MKQLPKTFNNCWITVAPIQMPLYNKIKVTWCSDFTVMALNYHNLIPAANLGGISF